MGSLKNFGEIVEIGNRGGQVEDIVRELVAGKIGFGIRKRDQTYYTSIDAKFNADYEYVG